MREVQLRVHFEFRLSAPGGRDLLPAATLALSRDMSYSETFALAKEQEEAALYRSMQSDIVAQVLRRLAAVPRPEGHSPPCRSVPTSSPQHLAKGPEAALHRARRRAAAGAGGAATLIRAAAREAGFGERKVFNVSGAHFDWSGLLGAAQAMSLFAERQLIEIRIPSGKPGKDGSEALQRYCERAAATTCSRSSTCPGSTASSRERLVHGARRRRRGRARRPRRAPALPQWIAQRLALQGQRVQGGDEGQRTLAFFADRVEGNLLAAHQEIQKLALLHPAGELGFEQIEAAVLNVARYDVFKLGEAVLAGHVARALRMLDGLRAEGEAAVLVHWTLADDIRALKRVRDARWRKAEPLPMALREARVWGVKERLFERALPLLTTQQLAALVRRRQPVRRPGQGPAAPGLAARPLGRAAPTGAARGASRFGTTTNPRPLRTEASPGPRASVAVPPVRPVDQRRAVFKSLEIAHDDLPSAARDRSAPPRAAARSRAGATRTGDRPAAARVEDVEHRMARCCPASSAASRSASTTCAPRARLTRPAPRGRSAHPADARRVEQAARAPASAAAG